MLNYIRMIDTFCRNSIMSIPIIVSMISLVDYKYIELTLGIILNLILNIIFKWITLYIPFIPDRYRPKNAKGCDACLDDRDCSHEIGMPSGHSQLIWFFVIYLWSLKPNLLNALILFPIAIYISLSRYYTNCHTLGQIMVGGFLGILISGFCYSHNFKVGC